MSGPISEPWDAEQRRLLKKMPKEWRKLATPAMLELLRKHESGEIEPPTREEVEKILRAAVEHGSS